MVRRFYTPFSRVLKGDVPGHAFHGNQYEAVGGEINWVDDYGKPKPSPIPFFQQNLKEFYESGGKVERYDSQNKVDALLAEVREKLHPGEAKDVVDEAHTPEERKAQGIRFIEEAVREHLGHIKVLGKDSQLLVARDKDGNIVSAVNVEPFQSNDGEKLSIGYLGSTKNAHGAATALEEQVAQLAAEKGIGVTSVPTVDSRPYHKKIGRSFNYRGASYWTPEECKAIASLPNPDVKVTKGDVPGHIFHGNQWTTVGNITTEVASFLSTNANKFYKSGGTTKTYNGPTTDISEATIKGIGDKARELENQLAQTTDPKEQEQVRRLAMGYERMESALRDIVAGQPGIVAYDKNGEIASVMTLANSKTLQTGKPYVKVLELGSTNKTPGSATTLEIEAAKYAANKGVFLWANYTGNSRGYHQLIGRNLDSEWSGSSEWTADECKAIASLNLGAPDAITKGDFEGHPFRGNQWEAGISSGDAELTRNKEALESSIKGLAIDVLEKAGKHTTAALARNGMGDPTQNNDAASGLKANLSADIAQRLGNRFDSKLLGRVASELDDKQVGIAAHLTTNDRYIKNGLTGAYEYLGNVKDPNFLKDSWLQRETNVSVQVGPGRYESKPSGKTTAEERYNNGEPGPTNFMGSIIVAGDDPELAKHFREEGVSRLIALWAKTSNGKGDSYGKSLTLQEAARREFGLQNTMQWALTPEVQKSVDNAMKKNGDLYQAFLRAQYDSTQELLKSKGITKLPLYRGMAWGSEFQKPDWAKQGGKTTLELRPLSSWTYNKSVAAKFARLGYEVKGHNIGQNGNVIEATVPAERILSIPATGVGCLNENEVVVLGGKEEVNVRDAGPLAMREGNYIDSPLPDEVKEENQ